MHQCLNQLITVDGLRYTTHLLVLNLNLPDFPLPILLPHYAYAYDIVLNGTELGGGSIRIHDQNIQKDVFTVIGLSDEEAQSKFGFLLEAFNYGPPPHGGIALGLDRVCALLTGSDSIREVIAFPKTASGGDPLTGAPTPITPAQRKRRLSTGLLLRSKSGQANHYRSRRNATIIAAVYTS
jgi:hypothetical protein